LAEAAKHARATAQRARDIANRYLTPEFDEDGMKPSQGSPKDEAGTN
jgi:hypothetical protein